MKRLIKYVLMLIFANTQIFGQVTTPFNTFGFPTDYIGWDITLGSPPLNIKTELAEPINFYTFAGSGTFNNLRMVIFDDPSGPFNAGFVGIGNNLGAYTPKFFLDVQNQINVNFSGASPINTLGIGYYIGGDMVLQIPGTSNLFGGTNSGTAWTTGTNNTFLGDRTGVTNNSGSWNTFIGFEAGAANDVEDFNTYVGTLSGTNMNGASNSFFGHHSGFNAIAGDFNTFIGEHAGFGTIANPSIGSHNTFVGNRAGEDYFNAHDNTIVGDLAGQTLFSGSENAFLGNLAGRFNTLGSDNTFIGFRSGQNNIDGTRNTLVGHLTSVQAFPAITNGTAIGASAAVVTDNTMILGDNTVNVGIGLSGITPGPQVQLEINTTGTSAGFGNSGFRLRDLTSLSTSTLTGVTKFLTVTNMGDVVLGDIPGAGGFVGACSPGLTLAQTNYITKVSALNEICFSQIYDDGITVGIGVGSSVTSAFRFQVSGDFLLQPNSGTNTGDLYMRDNSTNQRVLAMYGQAGNSTLAIGPLAGGNSTTAQNNVYIGLNSGSSTGDEIRNTFVGARSGEDYSSTATDGYNTFIGTVSGGDFVSGKKNTAIGEISGRNFTRGNNNTYVGAESGNSSLKDGDDNIFLGYQTSIGGTIGLTYADRNVIIGNGARGYTGAATSMTNSVSIGFANRVDCDNCVTLASQVFDGLREQQVGIGYTNPGGVAIGTTGAEAKLYVDDYNGAGTAAFFNGDVYSSTGNFLTSDPMFKDNVQTVTNVDAIFNQLEVKTFTYKINNFPSLTLPQGTHYGFLATDVEAVLPEAVKTFVNPAFYDSLGNLATAAFDFKAVNYTELVPVLFAAVKQQKVMLDSLTIVVSNCCTNPQPRINNGENPVIKSSIALSNKETIILNQNAPNPFKDKTEITYNIPESVKEAVIMFYDHSGKVIQKFEISHRGAGSLTVYGEDLTSGVYTYSLIVDGENHQTKRMVKQ